LTNPFPEMHNKYMTDFKDHSADDKVADVQQKDRRGLLPQAKGMWLKRDELLDFRALRCEMDERLK
jgi:hypothetical protein